MKKFLLALTLTLLLLGCVFASSNVTVNGVDFEIPSKYQGGELKNDMYRLDNDFSIRCVSDNVVNAIGLWAEEQDSSEDLSIDNHPVRHFYQYSKIHHGNWSHAYFASGKEVYEITWTGEKIDNDIEKLIKNTPPSKIDEDAFYDTLDKSYEIYKTQKIYQLNHDGEYNYNDAKHQSQYKQIEKQENRKFNEILLTYHKNN